MLKSFRIEALGDDGEWKTVWETNKNYQRLVRASLDVDTTAIRLIPIGTWGSEALINTYGSAVAHIFNFEVN